MKKLLNKALLMFIVLSAIFIYISILVWKKHIGEYKVPIFLIRFKNNIINLFGNVNRGGTKIIKDTRQAIEEAKSIVVNTVMKTNKSVKSKINDVEIKINRIITNTTNNVNTMVNNIQVNVVKVVVNSNIEIRAIGHTIQTNIVEGANYTESELNAAYYATMEWLDKAENKITTTMSDTATNIENIKTQVNLVISSGIDRINEEKTYATRKIEETYNKSITEIETEVNNAKTEVETAILNATTEVDSLIYKAQENVDIAKAKVIETRIKIENKIKKRV